LLADREVALRLAANRDIDRKLRAAVGSRFFWVYSLSLWDPDAFWKCVSGATAFSLVALVLKGLGPGGFTLAPLTASAMFEYFVLGLILMWMANLGPWLNPTNLSVIFTFIFRLYRKNRSIDDLSAHEINRLFPEGEDAAFPSSRLARIMSLRLRIKRSPVLGSLMIGATFAALMVALLLLTS